jgi:hypothetical protein
MTAGVIALIVGTVIIGLAYFLWHSEGFFQYVWRARATALAGKVGPQDPEVGRRGLRGALVIAALAGVVLLIAGVWSVIASS